MCVIPVQIYRIVNSISVFIVVVCIHRPSFLSGLEWLKENVVVEYWKQGQHIEISNHDSSTFNLQWWPLPSRSYYKHMLTIWRQRLEYLRARLVQTLLCVVGRKLSRQVSTPTRRVTAPWLPSIKSLERQSGMLITWYNKLGPTLVQYM